MSGYRTTHRAGDDLIAGARWILAENPQVARRFLDAAFATFDRIAAFPGFCSQARLKHRRLAKVRFCVMPPPFNRWLIFHHWIGAEVKILRGICGTQNSRGNPASFFA